MNYYVFAVLIVCLITFVKAEVIYISNVEDLCKIGKDVAYPFDGDYELTDDIDASGLNFVPIGDNFIRFIGKFDGKGHTVNGLYINYSQKMCVGLFGCIGSGAAISNVHIVADSVIGDVNVGGLVGGTTNATIIGCSFKGTVKGRGYVGGLVGHPYGGTITQCYSIGDVNGTDDDYLIGGLVGLNGAIVNQCYSVGNVNGKNSSVGGLAGNDYPSGMITQSYWNIETSGLTESAGGEGKTTAELMQQSTYEGWDFINVWQIDEGSGYPYFRPLPTSVLENRNANRNPNMSIKNRNKFAAEQLRVVDLRGRTYSNFSARKVPTGSYLINTQGTVKKMMILR